MKISSDWQKILDTYLKLEDTWKQELFLKNMNQNQRNYLLELVVQNQTEIAEKIASINSSSEVQPSIEYGSTYHTSDEHILNHREYSKSKKKWWSTFLPIFVVGVVVSGVSGMLFFAWISGSLNKLTFLNGFNENKAKASQTFGN